MERLSNSIANKISEQLDLNKDQKEVIAYGSFAAIQTIFAIVLVIILGAIFDVLIESLIISFTIAILRKYSGGIHASSPSICNFIGTFITIVQAIFILQLKDIISSNVIIFLGVGIFLWAFFLVFKLAPVDSPTKPIRKEEKKRRLKKASILILNIYLVIVFACIILLLSIGGESLVTYILCIYAGVLWQVFTLTKTGHMIIFKIDTILNQVLRLKGGKLS